MFQGLGNWFIGFLLTILGVIGLFVAAKGGTQDSYIFGLGLFLIAVVGLAHLIRHSWDRLEQQHHHH